MTYAWTMPSLMPQLLPWLMVLLLLVLRSNRAARAWWVWAPLLLVSVLLSGVVPLLPVPSEVQDIFSQVLDAAAFGLAAVWLTAPALAQRHRFLSFLCMTFTLGAAALLVFAVRQDWSDQAAMAGSLLVILAFILGAIAIALGLTGLACRRLFSPRRFAAWLSVWLLVGYTVAAAPFAVVAALSGGGFRWLEFAISILVAVAISLGITLPFLVLSFTNCLFKERLLKLLHMPEPVLPRSESPTVVQASDAGTTKENQSGGPNAG